MDRDDVEGAIAAAQYFLELYPYAYNTGDLTAWRQMSHPDCIFCASVIENVEELHDNGGYKVGGEVLFESVNASSDPASGLFGIEFELAQEASRDFSSRGDVLAEMEAREYLVRLAVMRARGGWQILEATPESIG